MDRLGKPFELLVTHVTKHYGLVKIFGQTDLKAGDVVEQYLRSLAGDLETSPPLSAGQISPGQSAIVRYGGGWHRAKVNTLSGIRVSVSLVDSGENLTCNLSNIRTVIHPQLQTIPPLAEEFILGEVIPPAGDWSKPSIEFVADALQGAVCRAMVIHRSHGYNFIRVFKRDSREPLVHDMVQCGMAISGYPNMDNIPPADTSGLSPPQVSVSPQFGGGQSSSSYPPTAVSPHNSQASSGWSSGKQRIPSNFSPTQGFSSAYRPLTLETGTWYPVFISFVEDGPTCFTLQLETLSKKLEEIMTGINNIKLARLPRTQLTAGSPCLARYSLDKSIYRAVILNTLDNTAKILYVDYGNREVVNLDEIYQIPATFLQPQILSLSCSLYQWPDHLPESANTAAKKRLETFTDRPLNCRVMSLEQGGVQGPRNVIQLYEDNVDIGAELRNWISRQLPAGGNGGGGDQNGGAHLQWPKLSGGSSRCAMPYSQVELVGTVDVFLSFQGKGPSLFYVQRADTTKQVQQIMKEIADLIKTGVRPLADPRPGSVCLARYTDGVWYRARVESYAVHTRQLAVEFVDFGNTDVVTVDQVSTIPPGLVTCLPAQAVPCKLSGNFGTQNESLVQPFLDIIQDNVFRIKVEKVLSNVCLVQASTTVPPLVSINSELASLVGHQVLTPVMGEGPVQLLVTHFESSNSFYGQPSKLGSELAIFLANLAEYCSRMGTRLYNGLESHAGEVCATLDTSQGNYRYYRCKILAEQRSTVDVRFLDVGGMERLERGALIQLPEELSNQPEFGFQCSLSTSIIITDQRLRKLFLDNFIEVVKVEDKGELKVIAITPNNNPNIRNSHILRFLKDISPPTPKPREEPYSSEQNQKLKELYDRQNKTVRDHGRGGPRYKESSSRYDRRRDEEYDRSQRRDRRDEYRSREDEYRSRDDDSRSRDDKYREQYRHRREEDDELDGGYRRGPNLKIARNFERGDLRNSLRERRAAREVTLSKPTTTSFKYPRLSVGARFEGKITWMYNPGHFYVQLEDRDDRFATIMEVMQKEFKSGPYEPKSWTKGSPVAAKYQDNCWYRGKAIGQRGKIVEVYFVDFGNTEKLDARDVLALPSEFGEIETQAVKAGLAGIEELGGNWENLKSGFSQYFTEDSYRVEVVKAGRYTLVDLNRGDIATDILRDIGGHPGEAGQHRNRGEERLRKNRRKEREGTGDSDTKSESSSRTGGKNAPKVDRKSAKDFLVGDYPVIESREFKGRSALVVVSHYNSWKELWVQIDEDAVIEFTKELNLDTKKLGTEVQQLQEGDRCLAVWDGLWYRAVIMDVINDDIKVHFVDYGNTEMVSLSDIRSGDPLHYKVPPLALKCKLDLKKANIERILEKSEYRLSVRFKGFFRNQFVIKLEKEKKEKREKKGNRGEKNVSLTHFESVRRLWYVPEEDLEQVGQLMEQLAELKEGLVIAKEVKEDTLYAVRFSEDGEIYRARVLEKSEDGIEVQYIDYGNHEVVDEDDVYDLPDEMTESGGYAKLLVLKGTEYALDSDELKEGLEEHLAEQSIQIKHTQGKEEEGILIVEGRPLNLNKWLRYTSDFNLFRHLGTVRLDCYVSNTESSGQIWIIEKSMLESLETMMKDLQARAPSFSRLKRVEQGRIVCAKFSQDGDYYRVKIEEIAEEKAGIHYLDFGNRETVLAEDLLDLPTGFSLHPGYAMKVEVDSKGPCRMLAPGEMEAIISEGGQLVAELVQPRLSIVRIYSGGRRVGYQPLDGSGGSDPLMCLPPARLRLGATRTGLLTTLAPSTFTVQDVLYACSIAEKLHKLDLEPVVETSNLEIGKIYIEEESEGKRRRRRIVVVELHGDTATVKDLDTLAIDVIDLEKINSCPDSLLKLPPAALTAASLAASTKDRYKLLNQLVTISVTDNTLTLDPLRLKTGLRTGSQELFQFVCSSSPPSLSLTIPSRNWIRGLTAEELCNIRNSIQQSFAEQTQLQLLDSELVQQQRVEEITDDTTVMVDDDHSSVPVASPVFEAASELILNPGSRSVQLHSDLAKLTLNDTEDVKVLSNHYSSEPAMVTLPRLSELRASLENELYSVEERTELAAVCSGSLALYTEEGVYSRCLVHGREGDTVEIYLLDSGQTRLCSSEELTEMPPSLLSIPALALMVDTTLISRTLVEGELFKAKLTFSDNKRLQLSDAI